MNLRNKYLTGGLWIFAFQIICTLATLYAAQSYFTVLLFVCIILTIILSLGFLLLLQQSNKASKKCEEETERLRQREKARLQRSEEVTKDKKDQKSFDNNEMLARIMPAAGTDFENVTAYAENLLQNIAKEMEIVTGLLFVLKDADQMFHISGQYAYYSEERPRSFPLDETLSGQVAKNRKMLNLNDLPENYITILSGLGKSAPRHLMIAPIVFNHNSIGILELASFKPFGENEELLIRNICESMAPLLNELRSHEV